MSAECYPMTLLPHLSRLFTDYLSIDAEASDSAVAKWYAGGPGDNRWMHADAGEGTVDRPAISSILQQQAAGYHAGPETLKNIELLRNGARAVVTGQQVGLLGGPLLVLLKAASAVARAAAATAASGIPHVPVFWLASEDHDLAEVDQVTLPAKRSLETVRLGLSGQGQPVGGLLLGEAVNPTLDTVRELLAYAPICDLLASCYRPEATLAGAFGSWMTQLFAPFGLVVLDAAERAVHRLGIQALTAAIEDAEELEAALLLRTKELEAAGYHAQVLVKPGASLLFLLAEKTGQRLPLKRGADGLWKAGVETFSRSQLLAVLSETPERISPNALLRPIFQDTVLPTAAYIGGPAEIAYFAQSQVVYKRVLGRQTPVLPRFSATLIEPAIAHVMAQHELTLEDIYKANTGDELTLRLGARAMPIEGKRRIAAAGNAVDTELSALTDYLRTLDPSLGRSAEVSASKMRYQMNRLRRMAATFEAQKNASLRRHADALLQHLLPEAHPQERILGGVWFLAQSGQVVRTGDAHPLIAHLVQAASQMCLGHSVLNL